MFLCTNNLDSKIPLCISLGNACGPAINLRDLKIRKEAYPFDWIVSPSSALYKALTDDFSQFLTDIKPRPDNTGVIDSYGFHFTHDWPTEHQPVIDAATSDFVGNAVLHGQWEEVVPLVREKYLRRIKRFKEACLGQEKVVFIRWNSRKEDLEILRDVFRNKYPNLDFILIAVSHEEDFKEPWNIPYIKNFCRDQWYDPMGLARMLAQVDPAFNDIINTKNIDIDTESHDGHESCCSCNCDCDF